MSSLAPEAVLALLAERFGPEARVSPLSGDASTRRYLRIETDSGSAVAAVYPEPFEEEGFPFVEVQRLLASWELPVPAVLGLDGAHGLVLLEDLGDRTLQEALGGGLAAEAVRSLYRQALDQLVVLQAESQRGPHGASCFSVAFDVEKLSWELHYFEKHFLEGLRGASLSVEDRSTLAQAFHGLVTELASWPRVLCHRDFHSRNLMLHRERLYWIDFQDARLGPATYDLVSLLRDAYVELDPALVEELAEEFRQRALPAEPRSGFLRRQGLTAVQRGLKALGTFGYMATVRENPVYLGYVPRALAAVRADLEPQPELEPLRRVLARHIEELS